MQNGKSELDSIKDWYEYNSFVRKRYLKDIFEKIPEEERHKDRGASFPSIIDIYLHVLDAYRWWFLHVYPNKIETYTRLRGQKLAMKQIVEEENKIGDYVLSFVRNLKPADLISSSLLKMTGVLRH